MKILAATLVVLSVNSMAETELFIPNYIGDKDVKVATFHEFDLAYNSRVICNTLIEYATRSKQLPQGLEFECRSVR